MLKPLLALSTIAVLAAPAAAERLSPEARLERALEGRVAGEPVSCIDPRINSSTQIIDRTAILYESTGSTVYVNRPRGGERSLDRSDVLITEIRGGQLCSGDVVRLAEPGMLTPTGFVLLGDFVPYRRAPRAQ